MKQVIIRVEEDNLESKEIIVQIFNNQKSLFFLETVYQKKITKEIDDLKLCEELINIIIKLDYQNLKIILINCSSTLTFLTIEIPKMSKIKILENLNTEINNMFFSKIEQEKRNDYYLECDLLKKDFKKSIYRFKIDAKKDFQINKIFKKHRINKLSIVKFDQLTEQLYEELKIKTTNKVMMIYFFEDQVKINILLFGKVIKEMSFKNYLKPLMIISNGEKINVLNQILEENIQDLSQIINELIEKEKISLLLIYTLTYANPLLFNQLSKYIKCDKRTLNYEEWLIKTIRGFHYD